MKEKHLIIVRLVFIMFISKIRTVLTTLGTRRSPTMLSSSPHSTLSSSIDNVLQHKFSVAPMMEYTDAHQRFFMRLISKEAVLYTEMVVSNALVRTDDQERLLEANFNEENPLVLQLGGSDPEQMKSAVKIASSYGYAQFNINCGCPSEKVAGSGCFGAALMLQPKLVSQLAASVYDATGKPATIKCRIGVDDADSYEQLAAFVAEVSAAGGVRHFLVHARKAVLAKNFSPRDNRSIPPLKYEYVYRLAHDFPALHFSVNGGVTTYEEVAEHLSQGVAGVMVGRSVINQPFYWNNIDSEIYGKASEGLNRREIMFQYAAYADKVEAKQGIKVRRALLKPVLGLFFGEANGKLFKRKLDFLIRDVERSIGVGVILEAMSCLEDQVLLADAPSNRSSAAASRNEQTSKGDSGVGQAALTKLIYSD